MSAPWEYLWKAHSLDFSEALVQIICLESPTNLLMYIRADIVILFVQKKLTPVATLESSALLHFPEGDKGERFTQHPFSGPTIIY